MTSAGTCCVSDPPEQTDHAAAASEVRFILQKTLQTGQSLTLLLLQANRIYEDVIEDAGQRRPPAETLTEYSYITYRKASGIQTDGEYSLLTAARPPKVRLQSFLGTSLSFIQKGS